MKQGALAFRVTLALATLFLLALAYHVRFIQDDAFISFRYAGHLERGWGLVWNQGDRIEGFTNFLWTLLIAAAIKLSVDPISASFGLGIACYALTLLGTNLLLAELRIAKPDRLLALCCLGLNYSVAAYATGGLETSLQTALVVLGFWTYARRSARAVLDDALLSSVLALAMWNRLDAGLSAALLLSARGLEILGLSPLRREGVSTESEAVPRTHALAALVAPFLMIVGALLLFKYLYFHDIVPNTYYAKTDAPAEIARKAGTQYVSSFVRVYRWQPVCALALAGFVVSLWQRARAGVLLSLFSLAWVLYVIRVGGDFMEFRFLIPVLPCAVALAFVALRPLKRLGLVAGMLVAGYVAWGSWEYYQYSQKNPFIEGTLHTETIPALRDHVTGPGQDWILLGKRLGQLFDHDHSVTIAVAAAGAIPYYSRLRTIDMLGLNDPWVAMFGKPLSNRPGHQKIATLEYLAYQGTNLVFHPWAVGDHEERCERYRLSNIFPRYVPFSTGFPLPRTAKIVELPLRPSPGTRTLYLIPHPRIERLISERKLRTWEIERVW